MSCLNLWKKRLGHVPEWVWQRTETETLVLADNDLSEVSEEIGRLKNLRMLDLGHNRLTQVPDALAGLDGLTDFLYLHDNQLTSLPSSFDSLTKLRYLNISENAFEVLPECISWMTSLIELRASDNRLACFRILSGVWRVCGSCTCETTSWHRCPSRLERCKNCARSISAATR